VPERLLMKRAPKVSDAPKVLIDGQTRDGICKRSRLKTIDNTTQASFKRGHYEAILEKQRDLIEDAEGAKIAE
jgi:hypothetical protein